MVGLGSIGQRHLRNIKKLYGEKHEIIAYRVRRLQRTFSDDMKIRDGISVEEEFKIKVFTDLDDALDEKPDIAFITNITSQHISCALKIAEAGCDIFMEKPLSDCMEGVLELKELVKSKNLIFYMGYQNRFHPCIQDVKRLLTNIGNITNVDSEFGERLSTMHTYENYRDTYMARRDMGGGAVLNLQIHALDYIQWLLGTPTSVYSISSNACNLDVDVEASVSSLYILENHEAGKISVYAHTDFFQYPPVHTCKFIGDKGRIEIDLNKAITVEYIEGKLTHYIEHMEFTRNDMFLTELMDFFKCIEMRSNPSLDIEQGIRGLKMALMAKDSAETGSFTLWEEYK